MLFKALATVGVMALCVPAAYPATTHQINITGLAFVPGNQTITQGDTIRWTNLDGVSHSSTSDNGVWDSGTINPSQSYSRVFATTGTFPYHCVFHHSMMDTITVIPVADWTINIGEFFFNPAVIQIQPGQLVRWVNTGARMHTSTSDELIWDSDSIGPGEHYDHTFTTEGVFHYHCQMHPLVMKGTVIVGRPDSVAFDIHIIDYAFSPQDTTISVGQNIRWINFGTMEHTTSDTSANLWDSGPLNPGYVFTLHASQPGIFHYICNFHPQMTGTIAILDTTASQGCAYLLGDINFNGVANGLDIVYAVRFFKGGPHPPYSCDCPTHGPTYIAGDVNGNCSFNGLDIVYFVNYLKGGPSLRSCLDCPPFSPAPTPLFVNSHPVNKNAR
ncbi:MAG TPA: hypothetical protein DEO84_12725 [candidate division Zixibacteria bacterium]|nr:hypothetical protein [candidate division Zixibacteria bacterium]